MPCAVFSQRRKLRSAPMCSLKEMNIQGGLSEVRGVISSWGSGGGNGVLEERPSGGKSWNQE